MIPTPSILNLMSNDYHGAMYFITYIYRHLFMHLGSIKIESEWSLSMLDTVSLGCFILVSLLLTSGWPERFSQRPGDVRYLRLLPLLQNMYRLRTPGFYKNAILYTVSDLDPIYLVHLSRLSYHWRDQHCSVPCWARCSTKSHLRQNRWQIDSIAPGQQALVYKEHTHTHLINTHPSRLPPNHGTYICQFWGEISTTLLSHKDIQHASARCSYTHSTHIFVQLHARTLFFLSQKCINLTVDWFFGINGTMTCGCLEHWRIPRTKQ